MKTYNIQLDKEQIFSLIAQLNDEELTYFYTYL